ncbi:uncharacterized protein [Henckelia pumila]|uniref:uncharacterized protein n=1 Tax=Henckelia pumila TaxID=405737 RepID=UPI003C6DDBE1
MDKKSSSSFSFIFKRLNKKVAGGGLWRWKTSTGFRWKRRFNLHMWFVDGFLFRIVSVLEAIVLVSGLCFFFLCCGCHL